MNVGSHQEDKANVAIIQGDRQILKKIGIYTVY